MKIFLSYASQDRAVADTINRALLEQHHDVFFDRQDLPPGEEFHIQIRRAIEQADLFVFLVSEHALDPGSYTLNELGIAERVLQQASGRLLPVLLRPMAVDRLPAFLKSVTLLESPGNIAAAVAEAVHLIDWRRRRAWVRKAGGIVAALAFSVAGVWLARSCGVPAQELTGEDGAPAVLIPAGSFLMGDDEESPRREIYLDAFYLDKLEITTGRYAKFLTATGNAHPPEGWEVLNLDGDHELPVVGVDWNDATAYCQWTGRRLPTEAEWEKAARGTDARRYPWGDNSPTLKLANFENASPEAYGGGLEKVGTHPAGRSPFGVHDLAGNANEWVNDWYAESFPRSDIRNPHGPATGEARVIRGGGRYDSSERILATKRYHGNQDLRGADIGFRCARDVR